jgi:hypothetical protein
MGAAKKADAKATKKAVQKAVKVETKKKVRTRLVASSQCNYFCSSEQQMHGQPSTSPVLVGRVILGGGVLRGGV